MATKKNTKSPGNGMKMELPEGFERTGESQDERYYFVKDEGNFCRGLLLGRYQRSSGKGHYYLIESSIDGTHTVTRDRDPHVIKEGEIVALDETHQLSQEFPQLTDSPTKYEVFAGVLAKRTLDNGNTFISWKTGAKAVGRKAFGKASEKPSNDDSDFDDNGLPF